MPLSSDRESGDILRILFGISSSRLMPCTLLLLTCIGHIPLVLHGVQALTLSPTRELASQTEKTILAASHFMNIQSHACIGGKSLGEDIRKLPHAVHVVSGTPGRVCDMIERSMLCSRAIKVVLDESDEMLSGGFTYQISDVCRYLPLELQLHYPMRY